MQSERKARLEQRNRAQNAVWRQNLVISTCVWAVGPLPRFSQTLPAETVYFRMSFRGITRKSGNTITRSGELISVALPEKEWLCATQGLPEKKS